MQPTGTSKGSRDLQPQVAVNLGRGSRVEPYRFSVELPDQLQAEDRTLTLALGPDLARSGAAYEHVVRDERLWALVTADGAPPSLEVFLRALRDRRLRGRREVEGPQARPEITEARLRLLLVAHDATRMFVAAWHRDGAPVLDWSTHTVEVGADALVRLLDLITDAADAAQALRTLETRNTLAPDDPTRNLGATSLEPRLRGLLSELSQSTTRPGLRGTTVEWLTDLAWHALLVDSPCYRRTDELTLQVSLTGSSHDRPFRRLEPPASIRRNTFQGLAQVTRAARECTAAGFHPRPVRELREGLFGAVADLAFAVHARHQHAGPGVHAPLPIVVTTAFDVELERSLWASPHRGGRYVVALPVVVQGTRPLPTSARGPDGEREKESRFGMLRWVAGIFPVEGPDLSDDETTRPEDTAAILTPLPPGTGRNPQPGGWQWLDDLLADGKELPGPLVLKLNGSPLHEVTSVPRAPGLLRRQQDATPVIQATVLSELDVLQVTHVDVWTFAARVGNAQESGDGQTTGRIEQGLPPVLASEFAHPDRYWLLAGQRLEEWSSRLQLFLQLARATAGPTEDEQVAAAVVSDTFDEDRVGLLEALGVARVHLDPHDLAGPVRRAAEDLRRDLP